ncbi:GtrA family protein [Bacillus marasmi]|uniref:GtrA family protein n=1 Tax=Bacillus marasmi TaxID=1926279 RepID=UPI0011C91F9D|nr:GtrA family protein [Bacillus marasmi]
MSLSLAKKNDVISYVFFGVLTTLINIISYAILVRFNLDYKVATTIAWIISVIFAFITNKLYVFRSKQMNFIIVMKEMMTFTFFRLLSYFLDIVTMIIAIEYFKLDDLFSKIFANILVIVFNYFASKYFVFKKGSHNN